MTQADSFAPQRRAWLALGLASLAGCATRSAVSPGGTGTSQPLAGTGLPGPPPMVASFSQAKVGQLPVGWLPYVMHPGRQTTRYEVVADSTGSVLHALAQSTASGLRCAVDIDPLLRPTLRFSWRATRMPGEATVEDPEFDDSPARVLIAFEGDSARLSIRDRIFFEQVELFTGHRLPFATLMYVWDGQQAPGTVTPNHRTGRVRYLTVESGDHHVGQWLHYQRDVQADYQRVFGEAPGRISSVGVLTNSDGLKLDLEAWYGDISLT